MEPAASSIVGNIEAHSEMVERAKHHDGSVKVTHIISVERSGSQATLESQLAAIDDEDSFPEGGLRAWLVVLGAWLSLVASFGFEVSIGPIQDYLSQHQLSTYTARDIGWLPSVFVYLSLGLGIWVGPLFDRYGPRWIALLGSAGYVAMMFLLAECKMYWQFLLCLGFLGGTTAAMLTTTSLACVAHWFKRRRGLTQGIAMCGSSFGGLVVPLVLKYTLPKYGYRWSIRIIGFMFFGCLVVSNMIMRARIPPTRSSKNRGIVSFSIFGDMRLSLLTISVFCLEIVLFGIQGILPTYATLSTHYPSDTGFYLVSVMNGASSCGRLLAGHMSDKAGRFNTLLVSAVITLLAIVAIWLPFGQSNLGALYAFIAIFGFLTGCWAALVPACIGQLCRADEFGRYYGSVYFLASSATLVSVPISGELVQAVGAQAMIGFYCAVLTVGVITFTASRWACLGWRWHWMKKI